MGVFGEFSGVGDLFYTFDENKAVVGEHESFLLFGYYGVGVLDSLYLLRVWLLFDHGQYFSGGAHGAIKITSRSIIYYLCLRVKTNIKDN